ncbi:MAG: hypothetical protein Q9P01_08960 [Anaerolineae bacterium]|nr:hypothetical protein [Anaerolineae bacterium]
MKTIIDDNPEDFALCLHNVSFNMRKCAINAVESLLCGKIIIMRDLLQKEIKGYKLVQLIGSGGFGAVYRAHQAWRVTGEVAIKQAGFA